MIALGPTAPQGPTAGNTEVGTEVVDEVGTGRIDGSGEPLMSLRGAGVDVDIRRAGRALVVVCLVALAVVTVILFLAGADKNAQITRLRQHGVPVVVTVSRCLGLMGGSGSNLAEYQCTGTFTAHGHPYDVAIPGTALYPPGAKLSGVTDPSDPALLSTNAVLAGEHPSWKVFILPIILLVILVLLVVGLVLRRRLVRGVTEPFPPVSRGASDLGPESAAR